VSAAPIEQPSPAHPATALAITIRLIEARVDFEAREARRASETLDEQVVAFGPRTTAEFRRQRQRPLEAIGLLDAKFSDVTKAAQASAAAAATTKTGTSSTDGISRA